jgi:serine protease Do
VGSKAKLNILRDGKNIVVDVTIAEFLKEVVQAMTQEPEEELPHEENAFAGFSVMSLTKNIAKQLDISKNERGVVIVKVEPFSVSEEAGLKKGDVIQEINKKKIDNLSDFNKVLKNIREGDTVLLFVNRNGSKFYITLKVYS